MYLTFGWDLDGFTVPLDADRKIFLHWRKEFFIRSRIVPELLILINCQCRDLCLCDTLRERRADVAFPEAI
jgi:hypothetical protein